MRLGTGVSSALLIGFSLLTGTATASPDDAGRCGRSEGKRIFWGDLHVHTAFSLDAYVAAATRTPEDAYRFARGAAEHLPDGTEIRLDRPLDFMAVTDHAEYFGVGQICGQQRTDIPYCRDLNDAVANDGVRAFREFFLPPLMANEKICPTGAEACLTAQIDLWARTQRAAHEAYEPCAFTTFVANEWTLSPDNLHWHRNLVFRSDVVPRVPINVLDEPTQADMWRALEARCRPEEHCDVLAIPHNTNLGMGGSISTAEDTPELRALRMRYERLAEIFQHKGQSECWIAGPFTDEACDYEIALPVRAGQSVTAGPPEFTDAELDRLAAGYLRPTLAEGLGTQVRDGVNPLRLGFVGATDTHGARPGYVEEADWQGTFSGLDAQPAGRQRLKMFNPGGLTAVWAEENTREAIFAALARREVYATTGPRIRLRFSHTIDAVADPCGRRPEKGATDVSMGGSLPANAPGAPRFMVEAAMDRTPLVAIDIVRLSHEDGEVRQHVETFELEAGRVEWCVSWIDEAHEAGDVALWYARVREASTPRWNSTPEAPVEVQERAWSSPIWSLPER